MKQEKRIKSEALLEAIGEIDDGMLEEALSYRKKPKVNVKLVAIAASFALMFALIGGNALIKRFSGMIGENESGALPTSDTPNDAEAVITLDSVFEDLASAERYGYVDDPDTLPYLDGNVYIVWKHAGEERYYISDPLENKEFDTIKFALGEGDDAGIASPALNTYVWVLLGDGRVISPYLKASQGNISYEIFDYEVEIVPNEDFAIRLQSILG